MFLSALLPRDRLGGLGRKVGSACEEFEDNEDGYRVNVFESSAGASSPVRYTVIRLLLLLCVQQF